MTDRLIYRHRTKGDAPKIGDILAVYWSSYQAQGCSDVPTNLSFKVQYVHTTYKPELGNWWESDVAVQPILDGTV